MSKYKEKESLKHLLAKNTLAKWLQDAEISTTDVCKFAQFTWGKNQGVHTELKFHENNDHYYFENTPNDIGLILFVPDVVVFEKGSVRFIFEVIHKNPVSDVKKLTMQQYFFGTDSECYEVTAEEILSFDKSCVPDWINCNQIF